jgi:copper transport protein
MSRRTASNRRRANARRLAAAVAAAMAMGAAMPAQALAHAVLQHTTPHQNSSVDRAPESVRLDFNEPVEISLGSVRVFDSRGERVDTSEIRYPSGDQSSIAVGLRDRLGRGIYTTTYRVVSADGHPVSGGFSFGVGEEVTLQRGSPQVADLLGQTDAGDIVEAGYGVVRALHYAALLLLIGAAFFRLLVWPRDTTRQWPGALLVGTAIVGVVAAYAGVVFQGAVGAGVSLGHALDAEVIQGSIDTRIGNAWLLRALAWACLLVFVALMPKAKSRLEVLGLALPAGLIVGTLPYAGHADTQSPKALLIPSDVLHVLAAGAWLGGLVLLLVCFWPSRGAVPGAAEATKRFSRLALIAITVLVLAGSLQAWFYVGSVGALFDTTYGLALLAKTVLLMAIVWLAAGSRRRTRTLTDSGNDSNVSLRRSMRAEVVLAVLVLAATATLVRAAPPAADSEGPVVRQLDLGPMRVELDVEPAEVGPNNFHIYLFDRRTGEQVSRVQQMTVRLTQRDKGIGPIKLSISRKGPAHYELLNSPIGVPGTWQAELTARVSDFDEYSVRTMFKIRK